MVYASSVKRLQILIDEDLDAALERVSRRTGRSKGALVREAVRGHIKTRPAPERDAIFEMVGRDSFEPVSPKEIDDVVYDGR
jgi:predicted transcriptional regulator